MQFEGVGDAKATLIIAAIEFARRRIKPDGAKMETPADLLPHVRHYTDRKQEHFLCATINGANEILNIRVVSIGLIDRSPVHPREVYADALSDRASAIIVAHNHPSRWLVATSYGLSKIMTTSLGTRRWVFAPTLRNRFVFTGMVSRKTSPNS